MADNRFKNISDMVRNLTDDNEFVEAVDEALGRQKILRQLMAMRVTRDLSQADVSRKMGCSQSRVSKMENSADEQLRYGELRRYAEAVGCELVSGVKPHEMTPTEEVKCLARAVQNRLSRMAELAQGDADIARGVAKFFAEAFLNFSLIIGKTAALLPAQADGTPLCKFRVDVARVQTEPEQGEERDCMEAEDQDSSKFVAR